MERYTRDMTLDLVRVGCREFGGLSGSRYKVQAQVAVYLGG